MTHARATTVQVASVAAQVAQAVPHPPLLPRVPLSSTDAGNTSTWTWSNACTINVWHMLRPSLRPRMLPMRYAGFCGVHHTACSLQLTRCSAPHQAHALAAEACKLSHNGLTRSSSGGASPQRLQLLAACHKAAAALEVVSAELMCSEEARMRLESVCAEEESAASEAKQRLAMVDDFQVNQRLLARPMLA